MSIAGYRTIDNEYNDNNNSCDARMTNYNKKVPRHDKDIATDEDSLIFAEKWVVSFLSNSRSRHYILREFYASGYYDAYDTVTTFAEKRNLQISWFKEKRRCGRNYINSTFPALESLCTYCNVFFNHVEPTPCPVHHCSAIFCSRTCLESHIKLNQDLKHKKQNNI